MRGRWPGWNKISVRKPLAVASFIWTMALCSLSFLLNRDLPSGVVSVLVAVVPSCVVGYAASSAWEATHHAREEEEEKHE